jgi:hypothetical protein
MENRQDCLWYGGTIGTITYKEFEIFVSVYGDVNGTYYENGEMKEYVKDKNNSEVLVDLLGSYIKDDKELEEVVKYEFINNETLKENKKVLFLQNNNWIETEIFDNKNDRWVASGLESIFEEDDDVLSPFENLNYYIDYIKETQKKKILA